MKKRFTAIIASIAVSAGIFTACGQAQSAKSPDIDLGSVKEISRFEYPESVKYPQSDDYYNEKEQTFDDEGYNKAYDAWLTQTNARREASAGKTGSLWDFIEFSSQVMLTDKDIDNPAYSPLNIYMALGLLSDISSGNTKQQILDTLNISSSDELVKTSQALRKSVYVDDGLQSTVTGDSLWLNEDRSLNESVIKKAAEDYCASVYRGKFGSDDVDKALRSWINKQTNDLLKDSTEGIKLKNDDVLALISTIYFKSGWEQVFNKAENTEETFRGISGESKTEFMNQVFEGSCARGKDFTSVQKRLASDGYMTFILPNESKTVYDLINGTELYDYLKTGLSGWSDISPAMITFSMPKFDVTAEYDLIPVLEQLGITDVFDPKTADFSELTDGNNGIFVSKASHNARITVNEEGVEAAAYTMMAIEESALIETEELTFKLDRPFIYVIYNDAGIPLFIGTVNNL